MTSSEELRQARSALRSEMRARRVALRSELANHPAILEAHKKRARRRRLALLLLLLLLLLWSRCSCEEPTDGAPPPSPPSGTVDAPTTKPPPAVPKKPARRKPKIEAKLDSISRPNYDGERTGPPPWLEAMRLQVAARSPRLAACFEGSPEPGALRWTALVDEATGLVSDHELVGVGREVALSPPQRACVIEVLSKPRYRLTRTSLEPRALPVRVSLLLEF